MIVSGAFRFSGSVAIAALVCGLAANPAVSQSAPPGAAPAPAPAAPAAVPLVAAPAAPSPAPASGSAVADTAPKLPTATGPIIPAPALPAQPVINGPASPAATSPATPAVNKAATVKKRVAPPAPPRETALSTDPTPTLTPETFFATAKASERYAAIADAGGWPSVDGPVSPASKGKPVSTLRLRLAIEGDLVAPGRKGGGTATADDSLSLFDGRWTPDLSAAVKRFQERHGLKPTGTVAGAA